jgi:PilZ domain
VEKQREPVSGPWKSVRKHTRSPLAAHVEEVVGGRTTQGRTGDVSVGGILVLSKATIAPRSEVRVRFDLPGGRHVEVDGEVVHSTPGVRTGIKFLHLGEDDRQAIAEYVERIKPYKRRSARLPRRLLVSLRWQDLQGDWHEEPAETVLISRHGGMILTPARVKPGETTVVVWPETRQEAEACIVFRKLGGVRNLCELGFEFIGTDNFWGIEFPPDKPLWEATLS